jgi:hypothetical protein
MTFEEFFIKKRIDLPALQKAEPSLFSEFKTHYQQMGERSFDHTKKYWFNKLRRQYHLAPEIKPEKLHIPNPLTEQTITESLSETIAPKPEPKMGFVPKFKAAGVPKVPAEPQQQPQNEEKPKEGVQEDTQAAKPAPKLGFVPKFKSASAAKPPVEGNKAEDELPVKAEQAPEKPTETPAAKPAYKPRFNMKNMPPKAEE